MAKGVIWLVNQYAGSIYHGMQYRPYYLGQEFIKHGYEVHVISGSFSHQFTTQPTTSGEITHENIDGINYHWVKLNAYGNSSGVGRIKNMWTFSRKLRSIPQAIGNTPDVIVMSSPSLFPIRRLVKWKRKYAAKLIVEVRDLWPLTLVELGKVSASHPFVILLQRMENYMYKKADFVVSLLPAAAKHMQSHGMQAGKFKYIPNGVSPAAEEENMPLDDAVAEQIPKGKFVVGYAGSIGLANAMEYFVAAADSLKDHQNIHFVLVGKGAEVENLKTQAAGLSNVTFLEPVGKRQVQSLLAAFDACYIGWRKEEIYRFGISANKLFEYLLSRKPIVHSTNAANDPVKEAGAGISVDAEDPSAIAHAISKLADCSEGERQKMGESGMQYVKDHHLYDKLAQQYIELF